MKATLPPELRAKAQELIPEFNAEQFVEDLGGDAEVVSVGQDIDKMKNIIGNLMLGIEDFRTKNWSDDAIVMQFTAENIEAVQMLLHGFVPDDEDQLDYEGIAIYLSAMLTVALQALVDHASE